MAKWQVNDLASTSKSVFIQGPDESLRLYMDYDDVDHDMVDEALIRILYALNQEWS